MSKATKGTIMDIDSKWGYVFTEDCNLVKMRMKPGMSIGKEIETNMDTNVNMNVNDVKARRSFRYGFPRFAAIAAGFVLLLVAGLFISQGTLLNPTYATIAIDVNPSLEMSLNRQLEVVSVKAMNEEAKRLLEGRSFKGLFWQDALEQWSAIVREQYREQYRYMLLSALMPEDAVQLRTQLMNMEGVRNQGELSGIQVRVIYSNDAAIAGEARKNGLSLGRQMLLNQARLQDRNWDEASISDIPVGELCRMLLKEGEQNQTQVSQQLRQMMGKTTETGFTGATETNRETNRSGQDSGTDGSSAEQTDQYTNRETNRETNQETNDQTNSSSQDADNDGGSQQTSRNTGQGDDGATGQTSGSNQDGSGQGGQGSGQGG